MTLATDLQEKHGARRRFFLKIAGLKPVLWQPYNLPERNGLAVDEGAPGPHSSEDLSLLAHWRFDEYATGNPLDELNVTTLSQQGTVPVQSGGQFARARGPFSALNYFRVTPTAKIQPKTITVSTWLYPASATQVQFGKVIHQASALATAGYSWTLQFDSTDTGLQFIVTHPDDTTTTATMSGTITALAWHHIVCTFDGDTVSIYVDGVLDASTAVGSTTTIGQYDTSYLTVGRDDATTTELFDGWIDETAIYDGAKSAEWVYRVYQAGLGYSRPGLEVLQMPNIEHHIELDFEDMRSSFSAM